MHYALTTFNWAVIRLRSSNNTRLIFCIRMTKEQHFDFPCSLNPIGIIHETKWKPHVMLLNSNSLLLSQNRWHLSGIIASVIFISYYYYFHNINNTLMIIIIIIIIIVIIIIIIVVVIIVIVIFIPTATVSAIHYFV